MIADDLNRAMEHERAGRLAESEKICRQIVDENPSVSAAWNLLAMIAMRAGHVEAAAAHLTRALELEPKSAALHANLGELKKRLGRTDEALMEFRKAVELEPNSAIMRNKLGVFLRSMGEFEESAAELARAISLDPNYADPHNNRGNALRDLGRFDEAIAEYREAIRLRPDLVEAHTNLGNVFSDRKQWKEALLAYQLAMRLRPNHIETAIRVAKVLRQVNRLDDALALGREAVRLRPGDAEAHNILGGIYYDRGEFEQAIGAFRKAIEINSTNPMLRKNLATALEAAGKSDEALATAKSVVDMNPDFAEGWDALGNLLADKGEYDDAAGAFRRAIHLQPNFALAHWNLSLILLLRGEYEAGWAEQEWRKKTNVESSPTDFPQPAWTGEDLQGRTILLHQEQGFGDVIQFARYFPMVEKRGGRVVIRCAPELSRLLSEMPRVDSVTSGKDADEFDCHCPMLSLPLIFKTRVDSIPNAVPYLKAPPAVAAGWRERLPATAGTLRVGIAWAGNPRRKLNQRRSIALEQFAPLANMKNVCFYSLQKGQKNVAAPAGMEWVDLSDDLHDFAETAGAIENLDMVITVDTAVAHLAGALGKKVWVLVGFVPAWRWMLDRNDSPWYPTMRLFRQPAMDDWNTPIRQMAQQLKDMTIR